MIKVNNLTKNYGSLEVLKNISFEIKQGRTYGFLGQNGAGKTTTMNILTGLINYNGGEIYFDNMNFKQNKYKLLPRVGYLTQDPVFYNFMNAYEYLKFIGELNRMPKSKIKTRSEELLELVRLIPSAKRRIGGYSGGMRQRLGIAVALFNDPAVLFLDEPTSALDPEGRMEVLELIGELKKQGKTVFLSTHILNDVERVCDEVSIIHNGEILLSQELENLKRNYVQPIYDIEFDHECKENERELFKQAWVEEVKIQKKKMSVIVNDINKSKIEMFKVLALSKNPVLGFSLRNSTLEDIFLRLVNKDGNL
jgi:ABC-2 type transport system ATP-binding protein